MSSMFMRKAHGFTLLEIMVVVFIISMSAVAVVSSLPSRSDDEAQHMAESFYHRVQLLADEAMLSGRDFGLEIDDEHRKVLFLVFTEQGWQPTKLTRLNNELDYEDDVNCEFTLSGNGWKKDDDRLFDDSDSLFEDMQFGDDEAPKYKPQVLLLANGIVTPFTMTFSTSSFQHEGWKVYVSSSGQVKLTDGSEHEQE